MRYFMRYLTILGIGLLIGIVSQNKHTFPPDMQTYFKHSVWQVLTLTMEDGEPIEGTGSGCFITRGLLLTNAHVVKGAMEIRVRNHNRALEFDAVVIKYSEWDDLALLRVHSGGYLPMTVPLGKFPAQGVDIYSAGYGLSKHISYQVGAAQGIRFLDIYNRDFPSDYHASIPTIMGDSGSCVLTRDMEIVGVRNAIEAASTMSEMGDFIRHPVSHMALILGPERIRAFLETKEHHIEEAEE